MCITFNEVQYLFLIFLFSDSYNVRMGIEVGETKILVCVVPLLHRRYVYGHPNRMTLEKVWSNNIFAPYPLQTIVRDLRVNAPNFHEFTTVEEIFKPKKAVFMISTIYYGSMGEVIDASKIKDCGRIQSKNNEIKCNNRKFIYFNSQ